jgi:hypothetical protein
MRIYLVLRAPITIHKTMKSAISIRTKLMYQMHVEALRHRFVSYKKFRCLPVAAAELWRTFFSENDYTYCMSLKLCSLCFKHCISKTLIVRILSKMLYDRLRYNWRFNSDETELWKKWLINLWCFDMYQGIVHCASMRYWKTQT